MRPTRPTHLLTRALALAVPCLLVAGFAPGASATTRAAGPTDGARASRVTDYGLLSSSWGVRVQLANGTVTTGREPYSLLACTRLVGRHKENYLGEVSRPEAGVTIDATRTVSDTYRQAEKKIVGASGSSTIGRLRVAPPADGGSGGGVLVFRGLRATTNAWHGPQGFKASAHLGYKTVSLSLPEGTDPAPDSPLGDLVDAVESGVNDAVIQVLQQADAPIDIPGVGTIELGFVRHNSFRHSSSAGVYALRIKVENGGPEINVGRSFSRIADDVKSGVLRGSAWGAQVSAASATLKSGKIGLQYLPCEGTGGKVVPYDVGGVDLGGQASLAGVADRVFGEQLSRGRVKAWTESAVSSMKLGNQLVVKGVVARANAFQDRRGKVASNARGTGIGRIVYQGEAQQVPGPGDTLALPGLGSIRGPVVERTRRSISVTALRLRLDADGSFIDLGRAKVAIKRS